MLAIPPSLCSRKYSPFINVNYFWFYFFISNLLVYHFEIRNFRSPYLWTVFLSQFLLFGAIFFKQSAMEYEWVFLIIIFFFTHAMTYGMIRIRMVEELKADHAKQNAQINLLLGRKRAPSDWP